MRHTSDSNMSVVCTSFGAPRNDGFHKRAGVSAIFYKENDDVQITDTRHDTLPDNGIRSPRSGRSEYLCRFSGPPERPEINLCSIGSDLPKRCGPVAIWYNGLAKRITSIGGAKQAEHEVIVYCEVNPDKLIIQAIAAVFKEMRARLGITLKPSD
jgi:hypothetical protein